VKLSFSSLFGSSDFESDPAPSFNPLSVTFVTRPNEDGTIDEVLIYAGARCIFHLEQLDHDAYWFAWYSGGDGTHDRHFNIHRRKKRVEITER
jgi:hypothetical protein